MLLQFFFTSEREVEGKNITGDIQQQFMVAIMLQ